MWPGAVAAPALAATAGVWGARLAPLDLLQAFHAVLGKNATGCDYVSLGPVEQNELVGKPNAFGSWLEGAGKRVSTEERVCGQRGFTSQDHWLGEARMGEAAMAPDG